MLKLKELESWAQASPEIEFDDLRVSPQWVIANKAHLTCRLWLEGICGTQLATNLGQASTAAVWLVS